MGWFNSPMVQGLAGLASAGQNWGQNAAAFGTNLLNLGIQRGLINEYDQSQWGNLEDQQRLLMGDVQGLSSNLTNMYNTNAVNTMTGFNRLSDAVRGQYGAVQNRFEQEGRAREAGLMSRFNQDVLGTARQRYNQGMNMLEGAGAQSRRDINRQFGEAGSAAAAGMRSRGFGGSTLAAAAQAGVQREQAGALGRLDESLLQQRLGTHTQLSGDVLNTQQAGLNLRTGLSGENLQRNLGMAMGGVNLTNQFGQQGLGLQQQIGQGQMGLLEGNTLREMNMQQGLWGQQAQHATNVLNARLGLYGGINVGYPDQGQMLQGMYQGGYASNPYQQPSQGGLFGMGGNGGAAGAALLTAGDIGLTTLLGGTINPALLMGTMASGYGLGQFLR